jgi:hypothetical protein
VPVGLFWTRVLFGAASLLYLKCLY